MVKIELYIQISDVKKKNHIKLRMKTQALAGMILSVNLCGNPRTKSRYLTKSRY